MKVIYQWRDGDEFFRIIKTGPDTYSGERLVKADEWEPTNILLVSPHLDILARVIERLQDDNERLRNKKEIKNEMW